MGLAILSDFDGTITDIDTAAYILDRFARGDWKAVDRLLEDGAITIDECMSRQFAMIGISRDRIIAELEAIVAPREGFPTLVEMCARNGATLRITSAGMDFYIRHFLKARGWGAIDVVAPRIDEGAGGITFSFPPLEQEGALNFKDDQVRMEKGRGNVVAYLGDGVSDLAAALSADLPFAVEGSRLDRLLEKSGKAYQRFTGFSEVLPVLFGHYFSGLKSSEPEFIQ